MKTLQNNVTPRRIKKQCKKTKHNIIKKKHKNQNKKKKKQELCNNEKGKIKEESLYRKIYVWGM